MPQPGETIGLIGLDPLGQAIAARLAGAGNRILVWDLRAETRRGYAKSTNPELAPGLADLGCECRLVVSSLPNEELRAAALGDADRPGFALQMPPGTLILDMGVAHPHAARLLAGALGRGGIGLVDAPALGDAAAARDGRLTLPTGGWHEFVDRLMPLLSLLGTVHRAGGPGSGHTLAAAMTYARFAQAAAAREALLVGESLGLAPELMADVASAAELPEADPRLAIAEALAAERGAELPRALGERADS
jgi:2-hydroxy-3-oxopropionate reductase